MVAGLAFLATAVATLFAQATGKRWAQTRKPYHGAWTVALALFALASAALATGVSTGWDDGTFRVFFLLGAIVNVPWLALGTVYLLGSARAGRIGRAVLLVFTGFAAGVMLSTPIHGEISERDLRYIKIGDEADVRLVNDQKVTGTVRYISRDASAQTRTFRVEVAIPNGDGSIPAGMTAEITLSAEPTDAVMLPRSVVTLGDKGDLGIRTVGKDDKVAFFPIDLVDDTPKGLVLGGIPKDARIIVAGQELVKEGDLVKPVEADQATISKLIGEATAGTQ